MRGDIALTAVSRLITALAGIAAAVISARTLGVEGRGHFYLVMTIALLAIQVANLGLPSSNAYFAARDRTLVRSLLANSLWISLVLGPMAALLLILINVAITDASSRPITELLWAVAIAPCALFFVLSTNLLAGIQAFRHQNAILVGASVVQLTLLALVAVYRPTVQAFLAVSFLSNLASCIATAGALLWLSPDSRTSWFNPTLLRQGLGYATRAFVILLLGFVLARMPVVALDLRGDAHSVGLVSVVAQFQDALAILPSSVAMVLFPKLVSANVSHRHRQVLVATAWVTAIMGGVCALLAILVHPLVALLFGVEFSGSAKALLLALPGVLLLSGVNVLGQYLAAAGFPVSTIVAWGIATCVGYALMTLNWGIAPAEQATAALSISYAVLALGVACAFAIQLKNATARSVA